MIAKRVVSIEKDFIFFYRGGRSSRVRRYVAMLLSQTYQDPKLLSLAGAATSVIFVETKVLSGQNYVCCNKHDFVATSILFFTTSILCRDKRVFRKTVSGSKNCQRLANSFSMQSMRKFVTDNSNYIRRSFYN